MGKAVRKENIEKILPEGGERRQHKWWGRVVLFLVVAVGVVAMIWAANECGRKEKLIKTGVRLERRAQIEVGRREKARKEKERAEKLELERREKMRSSKLVALTFDDGPGAATTPKLLDILREKGAKATFFVVGTKVEAAPEIVRRELMEGHEVGSHTTAHINLNEVGSAEEMQAEMAEMQRIVREATGREVGLFRTPYGYGIDRPVVMENVGMPVIFWSVDPGDWAVQNADAVTVDVVRMVYDGAIVLMHDLYEPSVEAAGRVIDELHGQGYEFVTISEMAELKDDPLVPGRVRFSF